MNKKIASALCAVSMTTALALPAMAEDDITVILNGNTLEFDVAPIIQEDRTLVPFRAIFEALGASVEWDGERQTVISTKGSDTCIFQIGEKKIFVNGVETPIDVPAIIKDDRTLVPLRAISEAYSCTVDWDGETRTVTITAE